MAATDLTPPTPDRSVRLVHMSDTHNLQGSISLKSLPDADICLHTGDLTDNGTDAELAAASTWLHSLRSKYKHVVVITGNHDWREVIKRAHQAHAHGTVDDDLDNALTDPEWIKSRLSGATHVLVHNEVTLCGLRIFGSSWCPWFDSDNPGDGRPSARKGRAQTYEYACAAHHRRGLDPPPEHKYHKIPHGLDILMTHGPADGILDLCETLRSSWGSSTRLRAAILTTRPRAHLFGHLHEQRGFWFRSKEGAPYQGGVTYAFRTKTQERLASSGPPPFDYPVQLVSCNAMKNHPGMDRASARIAGQARLIRHMQLPARGGQDVDHPSTPRHCTVVGVTGATRSGKSWLAESLRRRLLAEGRECAVLGQDGFWCGAVQVMLPSGESVQSEDEPECTDHERFYQVIKQAIATTQWPGVIIVEGFKLLHDARVAALLQRIYFLQLSEADCVARRSAAASELNPNSISAEMCREVVWPAHQRYVAASVQPLAGRVTVLKSTTDPSAMERLTGFILQEIKAESARDPTLFDKKSDQPSPACAWTFVPAEVFERKTRRA